jgi:hypothetical protein
MKLRCCALAAVSGLLLTAGQAKAALVITFSQSGPDVVANGVGSLNFLDLTFSGFEVGNNSVNASAGKALLGSVPPVYTDIYTGAILGPTSFGAGGGFDATSGSSTAPGGTGAGINASIGVIYVPGGYGAGDPFTVSSTWANTTIAGLGLTPGTYTWTWGDNNPDSLTIIVPASVPEPSTLFGCGIAIVALAGYGRRRRKAA